MTQNEEYYWIRAVSIDAQEGFGEEWQVGQFDHDIGDDSVCLMGSDVMSTRSQWEIGPKVIGHDELICELWRYVEAKEELRDRFAMAALAGFGCGVAPQRTAELCYEQADAMLEARKVRGCEPPQAETTNIGITQPATGGQR